MKRVMTSVASGVLLLLSATRAQAGVPVFEDDFNRADGALGSNWSVASPAGLSIVSNQACSPIGDQGVSLWAGMASATSDIRVEATMSNSLSAPSAALLIANLTSSPRYVYLGVEHLSGQPYARIQTGTPGSSPDTICATSADPLVLQAGVTYPISATMEPDGTATLSITDDLGVQTVSCEAGDHDYDRLVIRADDRSGGSQTCVDDFAFYGESASAAATCDDGIANGSETDIDCGGGTCDECSVNEMCAVGTDCTTGVCDAGLCAAATCDDNVENGAETGVDCGGSCSPCVGCDVSTPYPCFTAAKSSLQFADKDDNGKDKFAWSWKGGEAFTHDATSDPTVDGLFEICVTDNSDSVLLNTVLSPGEMCGDKPCWTKKAGKSYAFKDKEGSDDGIKALSLVSGVQGKSKISIKGGGALLDDPIQPFDPTVTVRLYDRSSGLCWESTFDSASIKKNGDKGQFKAAVKVE